MSVEYKYFIREFTDKEELRVFIEDEMNRPDSLDELVSVVNQPDGLLLAVGRSRRQIRTSGDQRFERSIDRQREHERFQGGTNYPEIQPGHRRARHGGFPREARAGGKAARPPRPPRPPQQQPSGQAGGGEQGNGNGGEES